MKSKREGRITPVVLFLKMKKAYLGWNLPIKPLIGFRGWCLAREILFRYFGY